MDNMQENETQSYNSAAEQTSIVGFALRSAFMSLAVVVLLFACILNFSPYTAMRFYSKLDMKDLALASAEKYLARNADEYDRLTGDNNKYADALYLAVNNSVYLMNENIAAKGYRSSATLYYARKADKYVNMYLDSNAMSMRTARVDEYNLAHTQPAIHPLVYSYGDTLVKVRFKLWHMLGNDSEISTRVSTATTGWNEASGEWDSDTASDMLDRAIPFFAQLTAYIETEFAYSEPNFRYSIKEIDEVTKETTTRTVDMKEAFEHDPLLNPNYISVDLYGDKPFSLFVNNDGSFTGLYNDVLYRFDSFVNVLKSKSLENLPNNPEADRAAHLRYTYGLKVMRDFTLSMANMTATLSAGNGFYDEGYRAALKSSANVYENKYQVRGVRVTRDGITQTGTYNMENWYNWGYLYDYLGFWRAVNN